MVNGASLMEIGLIILVGYVVSRFIHQKILRTAGLIIGIALIFGALEHPQDVLTYFQHLTNQLWPIAVKGAEHGTSTFVNTVDGIGRAATHSTQ